MPTESGATKWPLQTFQTWFFFVSEGSLLRAFVGYNNTYLVSFCCFCFPPRPMRSMPCSDEGLGWISKTRKKIIAEELPHSMVKNKIRSVIMLIALNFPCPSWVRISTTQLAKYPHVSYVEEYILNLFPCLLLEQKIMTANSKSLFLENF